jgi:hypothetical protein
MTHKLPEELYHLYKHWNKHIAHTAINTTNEIVCDNNQLLQSIITFAEERMNVWNKKYARLEPPYSDDPILQKYRFCNIFREFDRQTIFFHKHLSSLQDDFSLWLLNMFAARLIANTDTVAKLPVLRFSEEDNKRYYDSLTRLPPPKYGTPYVFPISTILKTDHPTRELFLAFGLHDKIARAAKYIVQWDNVGVADGVHALLATFGPHLEFLWTEVLIDVAYQFPEHINLFAPFPVGPGAKPTLLELTTKKHLSEALVMCASQNPLSLLQYKERTIPLSAENWEGICCEYRKYKNLSSGHGRKRLYKA